MNGSDPAMVTMSALLVDSDLDMGIYRIKSNHFAESTGLHGMIADSPVNGYYSLLGGVL